MSYDEHLISMAGGDGDQLADIERRAKDPFGTIKAGIGRVDADRDILLAIVREQAAKLEALRDLANAHGRHGFLVTPADIRAVLDPTP